MTAPPGTRPGPTRARKHGFDRTTRRKIVNWSIYVLTGAAVLVVLFPLVDIIYESFLQGGGVLFHPGFLTQQNPPACPRTLPCPTVGIWPDIQGSLVMVGIASLVAVPIGVFAAIFASEYRGRGLGKAISFTADVLTGIPSIIAGAFVYIFVIYYSPKLVFAPHLAIPHLLNLTPTIDLAPHLVIPSAIAGGLALSVLMIPIITRTTEEALRIVPDTMREAALALGIPKWKSTLRIVLVASLPGTLTGIMLGMMRATGEAAPLLFTALGSPYTITNLNSPTGAMPLFIYEWALALPYPNVLALAWGTTLFLLVFVLAANVLSRVFITRLERRMGRA